MFGTRFKYLTVFATALLYQNCIGKIESLNPKNRSQSFLINEATIDSNDLSVSFSSVGVASSYEVAVTSDAACEDTQFSMKNLKNTNPTITINIPGTYYVCVFAILSNGKRLASANNGYKITIGADDDEDDDGDDGDDDGDDDEVLTGDVDISTTDRFDVVIVDETRNVTFTLTNNSADAATNLSASALVAPFDYLGGSFPGTGGDCGSALASGDTCTFVVSIAPTATGTTTDTLELSYGPGSLSSTYDLTTKAVAGYETISKVAIQTDNKIITVGRINTNNGNDLRSYLQIKRYNTNKTLDTTFNSTGEVTAWLRDGADYPSGVVIQSDGKILVTGYSYDVDMTGPSIVDSQFFLIRLNTDGSFDTSFNGTGKVFTSVSPKCYAMDLALQTDGKIVVVGQANNGTGNNGNDFGVARYNTDGSLDTAFNGTGYIVTALNASWDDIAKSVRIQSDGKILVAGFAHVSGTDSEVAVIRYNTNGSLDTTYNGTGIFISAIGFLPDTGSDAVLQSDGKLVVGGTSYNGANTDFIVMRISTNGTLDAGFNGTGVYTHPVGPSTDTITKLALQSDGKIVAIGIAYVASIGSVAITRYNTNGTMDTAGFNTPTGFSTISYTGYSSSVGGLAIEASGKILVAGTNWPASGATTPPMGPIFIRYNADGTLDNTF